MVAQCSASNLYIYTVFRHPRYNSHRFKVPGEFLTWLNGKQVRSPLQYLCCPRNGKQAQLYQSATVNHHGKAIQPVLKTCLQARIPASDIVQKMLREVALIAIC
jgi:hypothetical protein